MTQELIINDVNWLDPQMIGLKCCFYESKGYGYVETESTLSKVSPEDVLDRFQSADGKWWQGCRLVDGDIIKRGRSEQTQPVPDGVFVTLFFSHRNPERDCKAENVDWQDGTYSSYQVQSGSFRGRVIADLKRNKIIVEPETVTIDKPLLERIAVALNTAKDNTQLLSEIAASETVGPLYQREITELNRLRDTLSDLTTS